MGCTGRLRPGEGRGGLRARFDLSYHRMNMLVSCRAVLSCGIGKRPETGHQTMQDIFEGEVRDYRFTTSFDAAANVLCPCTHTLRNVFLILVSDEHILVGKFTSNIPQISHFLTFAAVSLTLSPKGSINSCLFFIRYKAIL